ncbi:MAG: hypothetical protein ACI82I_000927 [Gammaproteobacteria bacterium]|jgi:hypothetical protein
MRELVAGTTKFNDLRRGVPQFPELSCGCASGVRLGNRRILAVGRDPWPAFGPSVRI